MVLARGWVNRGGHTKVGGTLSNSGATRGWRPCGLTTPGAQAGARWRSGSFGSRWSRRSSWRPPAATGPTTPMAKSEWPQRRALPATSTCWPASPAGHRGRHRRTPGRGLVTALRHLQPRGRVSQRRFATRQEATQPLPGRCWRDAMRRGGAAERKALERHLVDDLQATGVSKSGMLVSVNPAVFLEDWGFGDFQSLRPSPGGHPVQPNEASLLGMPLQRPSFHTLP
jgi:hypothetical protein